MKKLVFLTSEFPFTESSGAKVRDAANLRLLQEKFRVQILCAGVLPPASPLPAEQIPAHRAPWTQRLLYPLRAYVRNGFNPRLVELLAHHFEPGATLWISRLAFAQYIPAARRLGYRVVLDNHNVESDLYFALCRAGGFRPLEYWRAFQLRIWERRYAREADALVVTSEADRAALARLSGREALVLPNFINLDRFRAESLPQREILFLGTLDYEPNRQGLEWFARSVLPLAGDFLRRNQWALRVVGARAPASLRETLHTASMLLSENVPDTVPYLAQAEIVMVPLLSGSGTRLKILEAFAAGRAVISTRKGAEGIPALAHGENIFYADSAEEFARGLESLVNDQALRAKLGANARRLAEAQFDWRAGRPVISAFS